MFKAEWKYDEVNRWHECDGEDCVEVSNTAAHSFDNACDATCACGYTRSVNHDFTGEWQKNDAEHWHICKTGGCADGIWYYFYNSAGVMTANKTSSPIDKLC